MSVAAVFAAEGEAAFRVRERAAVVQALGGAKTAVISLGGGALENDDTFTDARRHTLVWLKATVPTLAARLSGNGDRPLFDRRSAGQIAGAGGRTRARVIGRPHVIVRRVACAQGVRSVERLLERCARIARWRTRVIAASGSGSASNSATNAPTTS